MSILKYLFPVPKEDSKRVLTFANDQDYISFRHHVFAKVNRHEVQLAEVGPRFEMKRKSFFQTLCQDQSTNSSLSSLRNQTRNHWLDRCRYRMGTSPLLSNLKEERRVVDLSLIVL
jgi:hypothetical protein